MPLLILCLAIRKGRNTHVLVGGGSEGVWCLYIKRIRKEGGKLSRVSSVWSPSPIFRFNSMDEEKNLNHFISKHFINKFLFRK